MVKIEVLTAPTAPFAALVETHADFCDRTAPPESCHRLPVSALFVPGITVWTAELDGRLAGMGALKQLSETEGEIKSMHTAAFARGRGVARALLDTLLQEASARGYAGLWLETGTHDDFAPARALYAAYGFTETGPFGNYVFDPHSVFMTRALDTAAARESTT